MVLGWVTVFERANHLGTYVTSHAGKFSLLPSAGWYMSTGQSEVMLYDWGAKAGMAHSICGWVAGKTVSLTRAIPECLIGELLSRPIRRCTNVLFKLV